MIDPLPSSASIESTLFGKDSTTEYDFVLRTRDVRKGELISNPGKNRYLLVPKNSRSKPVKGWSGLMVKNGVKLPC